MFLAMLAVAGLASCGNAPKTNENEIDETENLVAQEVVAGQPLDNAEFVLVELNGEVFVTPEDVAEENVPHIAFADGNVNASVGCNQLHAVYKVGEGGEIAFEYAALTKMACPDELRENEFVEAFNKVIKYDFTDNVIRFFDADGNVLFIGKVK